VVKPAASTDFAAVLPVIQKSILSHPAWSLIFSISKRRLKLVPDLLLLRCFFGGNLPKLSWPFKESRDKGAGSARF